MIKTIRANEAGLDLEEDDKSVYIYQDNVHFLLKPGRKVACAD